MTDSWLTDWFHLPLQSSRSTLHKSEVVLFFSFTHPAVKELYLEVYNFFFFFFYLIFKILFTEKEETSIKTLRRRKTSIKERPQVKVINGVCICVFPFEKCLLYYLQCFTSLMLTMFKDLQWGWELILDRYKLCFEGYKIGEKHICIHYSLTLKHWAETEWNCNAKKGLQTEAHPCKQSLLYCHLILSALYLLIM